MDDVVVPIWSLSTSGAASDVPAEVYETPDGGLTAERLTRLRQVLSAWSDEGPVILERYSVQPGDIPKGGQLVSAASPVMKTLGEIVGRVPTATAAEKASGSTEVLYRLVVPEKVAQGIVSGTARMMTADGGAAIRGSVLSGGKIAAQAKFVPVSAATGAASGAATGAGVAVASGAGSAAAGGAALVAAAPMLVLLAATAASVYAEEERRRALERLQESLDSLKQAVFDHERDQLHGATSAITKGTALLAEEGRLGATLGIDSAVYAIDTALATAERRIGDWEQRLKRLDGGATPTALEENFPGIAQVQDGEFIAKLRMAVFAISMKRRVAVLQAAEHTQLNPQLSLRRFLTTLTHDVEALDELEQRLTRVLESLASLQLQAPNKVHDVMFGRPEVRRLLQWSPRLHQLARTEGPPSKSKGDVELALVVSSDGSARVLSPTLLST